MAEHSSLNDIFARLDQSKANRAEEENRKRKLEAEAAEQERREKAAAESAVEKYQGYDRLRRRCPAERNGPVHPSDCNRLRTSWRYGWQREFDAFAC